DRVFERHGHSAEMEHHGGALRDLGDGAGERDGWVHGGDGMDATMGDHENADFPGFTHGLLVSMVSRRSVAERHESPMAQRAPGKRSPGIPHGESGHGRAATWRPSRGSSPEAAGNPDAATRRDGVPG